VGANAGHIDNNDNDDDDDDVESYMNIDNKGVRSEQLPAPYTGSRTSPRRGSSTFPSDSGNSNYYSSTHGGNINNNNNNTSHKEDQEHEHDRDNDSDHYSAKQKPLTTVDTFLQHVEVASRALHHDDKAEKSQVFRTILPLCVALIVVMWCSIFQASFFVYVKSSSGMAIDEVLYFVRLFSDLVGRPMTRLPRPYFLKVQKITMI
jgi:hypothetical protein